MCWPILCLDSDKFSTPNPSHGKGYGTTHFLQPIPQVLNKFRTELQDNISCPSTSQGGLVQPASTAPGRCTQVASATSITPHPAPLRASSSPTRIPCSSSVDMRDKGFSEKSAISITRAVRVSTGSVYDAKWKVFVAWCSEHEIDPLRTSVPQLAQFLEQKSGGGLASTRL